MLSLSLDKVIPLSETQQRQRDALEHRCPRRKWTLCEQPEQMDSASLHWRINSESTAARYGPKPETAEGPLLQLRCPSGFTGKEVGDLGSVVQKAVQVAVQHGCQLHRVLMRFLRSHPFLLSWQR